MHHVTLPENCWFSDMKCVCFVQKYPSSNLKCIGIVCFRLGVSNFMGWCVALKSPRKYVAGRITLEVGKVSKHRFLEWPKERTLLQGSL